MKGKFMSKSVLLARQGLTSRISSADEIQHNFISSLQAADHQSQPYDYWLLENILPPDMPKAVTDLPLSVPTGLNFCGRREANNGSRVYFTPENQEKYPVCRALAEAYKSQSVVNTIHKATGRDVSQVRLRIEYCQDTDGFWLEPHVDISVKRFTMLIYLSDDPALRDAGTDIYDSTPKHNIVTTSEYACNKGLIFIPGHNTWHGFTKRPIRGLRQCLIINYVGPEWKDQWELA
jgi:hypothetical protein